MVGTWGLYLRGLTGCGALFLLPLFFFLFQLLNALLQHIGPKVTLKIGQFLGTGEPVFSCLFENVLEREQSTSVRRGSLSDTPGEGVAWSHDTEEDAVLCTPVVPNGRGSANLNWHRSGTVFRLSTQTLDRLLIRRFCIFISHFLAF